MHPRPIGFRQLAAGNFPVDRGLQFLAILAIDQDGGRFVVDLLEPGQAFAESTDHVRVLSSDLVDEKKPGAGERYGIAMSKPTLTASDLSLPWLTV
jgi:hypothetical protein